MNRLSAVVGLALFIIPSNVCKAAVQVQSITVKGPRTGLYTFNTIFTPNLCSALKDDDLPHLTSEQVLTAKTAITTKLGAQTQCIVVFGVLVIGNIPDHDNYVGDDWIRLFANTIAIILDKNKDGTVDDPASASLMKSRPGSMHPWNAYLAGKEYDGGGWVFARADVTSDAVEDSFATIIGTTTTVKQGEDFGYNSLAQSMRAMTEEIFHAYQHKLGRAYPTEWGVSSAGCPMSRRLKEHEHFAHGAPFGCSTSSKTGARRLSDDDCTTPNPDAQKGCDYQKSTLMKCAYSVQCNWYTAQMCCRKKGEGATGADVTGGGCLFPGCAGIEWYYNLILEYTETKYPGDEHRIQGAGNDNMGYGGNAFPQTRAEVRAKLSAGGSDCQQVLANIENSTYAQPTAPFDWNYAPGFSANITKTSGVVSSSTWPTFPHALLATLGVVSLLA